MSNVAAFEQQGDTVLVGVTAVQVPAGTSKNAQRFRIRNTQTTAQYFTWGHDSGITYVGAPTAGVPSGRTIGMGPQTTETFTFPPNSYFIGNTAGAFEITPGDGL